MEMLAWLFCPILVIFAFFAGVTMERGAWPWRKR